MAAATAVKHERAADARRRLSQGIGRRRTAPHLLLDAQREMNAEVDAEPDEQHREGDGDEVQLADRNRRETSGPAQTDDQGQQRGADQTQRAQPDGEQDRDQDERT